MKLNISYPANGSQKIIEIDDERKLRPFMEKRMGTEVSNPIQTPIHPYPYTYIYTYPATIDEHPTHLTHLTHEICNAEQLLTVD